MGNPRQTPALSAHFPTPYTLQDATLIFDDSIQFLTPKPDWAAWFSAMGVDYSPLHGPRFSQADHAIDAALSGIGVMMGRRALVIKDIADGRLVAPYGVALTTGARFRLLYTMGAETSPQIAAFRDWIVAEITTTTTITEALKILPKGDE